MLNLELVKTMGLNELMNYVDSEGSEETIAVMYIILKHQVITNEDYQTLEELTEENSRLIEKNENIVSAMDSMNEIICNNITDCLIEIFETCQPRKKLTKEILHKHLSEIENNILPDDAEYLEDSIIAIKHWRKYV